MSTHTAHKKESTNKKTTKKESAKNTHSKGNGEWKGLLQVLPYLWLYPKRLIFVSILLVTAKVASVTLPIIMKQIINSLGSLEAQVVGGIIALVLFYGLINFLSTFLEYLRDLLFAKVGENTRSQVTLKVFQHLHSLSLEYHLSRKTGGLSHDIARGTNAIGFLFRFLIFRTLPNILTIVLVLGILLRLYSWYYSLIVAVAMISYVVYSFLVTEWQNKYQRLSNELDSKANTRAIDSLLNYETVKYFNNETHEFEVYQDHIKEWEVVRLKTRFSTMILNSGQSLIIALSVTSLLLMTALNVFNKSLTVGDMVLIHSYIIQLFVPLGFLGFVYMETKNSLAAISRMVKILEVDSDVKDHKDAEDIKMKPIKRKSFIEFDHVQFQYNPDRKILDDMSFSIGHNQKIGIVGGTGSGKTTIAKLLFRFYDITSGTILVNGQDISSIRQDSLRKIIGFVPQDSVLFNDSIYYNLQYGNPQASEKEIMEAVKIAELEAFIANLPKGMDTVVGERGLKLSGGEKQRIAIARVILKKPQIIVFDEATSALDSKTEKNIVKAFNNIAKNHTSLIIAHRLSTVVDADQILVLNHGQLVESGHHQELLTRKDGPGVYKQLWQYQQEHPQEAKSSKDASTKLEPESES